MIDKTEAKTNGYRIVELSTHIDEERSSRLEALKNLIPAFVNSDGAVNIDAIVDFVGPGNATSNNKGYELTFAGKGLARHLADIKTEKELKTELKQSKNFDETENLIIRGDNLDVLKILRQSYYGKIKMIYIDPPYNTQNDEFIYADNFQQSIEDLIEHLGLEEKTLNYISNMYGTRTHSGWLAFMYPRLKLARDLLTNDGVMFISIDDNEQANLKIMCDEIFGEENFVANFIWQDKYTTTNDKQGVSSQIDYVLCYAKSTEGFIPNKLPLREDYIKKTYRYNDNDSKGRYMTVQMYKKKGNYPYEIKSPTGKKWNKPWNFKKETMEAMIKDNKIFWGKDGDAVPRKKVYLSESKGINPINLLLLGKTVGFSEDGGKSIEKLFGDRNIFLYPKPPSLITHLSKISSNENDIILDFFAGSGTTAQAVMELNKKEGGGGGGGGGGSENSFLFNGTKKSNKKTINLLTIFAKTTILNLSFPLFVSSVPIVLGKK